MLTAFIEERVFLILVRIHPPLIEMSIIYVAHLNKNVDITQAFLYFQLESVLSD